MQRRVADLFIKILVEDKLVRASIGGTGEAKCMGNYAASLMGGEIANQKGYAKYLLQAR